MQRIYSLAKSGAIVALLLFAAASIAEAQTCPELFARPNFDQVEASVDRLRTARRAGLSVLPEDVARITNDGAYAVEGFLRENGIDYESLSVDGDPNRTVFKLNPSPASTQGRYVAMLKRRFPSMTFVVDPRKILNDGSDASVSARTGLFELGTYKLLRNPGLGESAWLHELVHLRNHGKVGMVWAHAGKVGSLGDVVIFDTYDKYQSFDEPDAYERSLHTVLKRMARSIAVGDRSAIDEDRTALARITKYLLDVSGRNLWTAVHLTESWSTLPKKIDPASAGGVVFRAQFQNDVGHIFVTVPFPDLLWQSGDAESAARNLFISMRILNQKRLEHFRAVAAAIENIKLTDDLESIEAARSDVHQMFLRRPR